MTDLKTISSGENQGLGAFFEFSISNAAQVFAFVVSLAYLSGFIAVTAHLGRFGIRDYDAFRVQYLIAGAMVVILFLLYLYVVGRHISSLDNDYLEMVSLIEALGGTGNGWRFFSMWFCLVELGVLVVVATVIAGSILFPLPNQATIVSIASIFAGKFLVDMALERPSGKKITRRGFVCLNFFHVIVVVTFIFFIEGLYSYLFMFFALVTFPAFAYVERRGNAKNPRFVTAYFAIFALIAIPGAFGASLYGSVKTSIGGGAGTHVQFILTGDTVPSELRHSLGGQDGKTEILTLIAETGTEFLVGKGVDDMRYTQLLRIKKDAVSAVLLDDPRAKSQIQK